MKTLAKIVVAVIVNAVIVLAASEWIAGFEINKDFKKILILALLLTALNFILKPILRLILAPLIILTLGLGLIAVNAFIFYILDLLSKDINILTTSALVYSAILAGAGNFLYHLATKK